MSMNASESHFQLSAKSVSCVRDDRRLFEGLSFSVQSHQLLMIEGANGSGKTSLLRILCGLTLPEDGAVHWCDHPIQQLGATYHSHICYVGHHNGIKQDLTVWENISMAHAMAPATKPDLQQGGDGQLQLALDKLGLDGLEDLMTYALSAGQRRRLALARCLIGQQRLWILDEPFTSLDKQGIALIEQHLQVHLANGGMAVVTSHQPLNFADVDVAHIRLAA